MHYVCVKQNIAILGTPIFKNFSVGKFDLFKSNTSFVSLIVSVYVSCGMTIESSCDVNLKM